MQKSRERNAPCFFDCLNLLPEVAVQQTLKGLAVAGLVAGHLVDGVVDGVQVVLLGARVCWLFSLHMCK